MPKLSDAIQKRVDELDAILKSKGLITVTDFLTGNFPLAKFSVAGGIRGNEDAFEKYLAEKAAEYLIMNIKPKLADDYDFSDEERGGVQDWVAGKASAYLDIYLNYYASKNKSLDKT